MEKMTINQAKNLFWSYKCSIYGLRTDYGDEIINQFFQLDIPEIVLKYWTQEFFEIQCMNKIIDVNLLEKVSTKDNIDILLKLIQEKSMTMTDLERLIIVEGLLGRRDFKYMKHDKIEPVFVAYKHKWLDTLNCIFATIDILMNLIEHKEDNRFLHAKEKLEYTRKFVEKKFKLKR